MSRPVRDRLLALGRVSHFTKGQRIFDPFHVPDSLLFLVDGSIRVSQTSGSGRDIVLYRVEAGESCVLTTACMLAEEAYNAEGTAKPEAPAVDLPRPAFDRLVAEEPAFRSFVFAAYSRRLIDLLRVVDDVAFGRIDVRLADRLLTLAGAQGEITATHQQLASELGTAREVISRVLQDFQRREFITQSRGHVTILDRAGLTALAQSA
ncbi:Crp/Fnr family transcriptional regulator [Phaeobacter sp. HF9A]|nr:Crp/Fnr family transcriptional regulator [Phaeobacter sp. HF9A]